MLVAKQVGKHASTYFIFGIFGIYVFFFVFVIYAMMMLENMFVHMFKQHRKTRTCWML